MGTEMTSASMVLAAKTLLVVIFFGLSSLIAISTVILIY
jgi:hypothetical protein